MGKREERKEILGREGVDGVQSRELRGRVRGVDKEG